MQNDDVFLIPEYFAAAIGYITINFANLEYQLSETINLLVENDWESRDVGKIITAELSFQKLIQLTCALLKEINIDTNIWNEFDEISKSLTVLENKRNTIIHSIWKFNGRNNTIERIKSTAKRDGYKVHFEVYSHQDLLDLDAEFMGLLKKIKSFNRIFYEIKFANLQKRLRQYRVN